MIWVGKGKRKIDKQNPDPCMTLGTCIATDTNTCSHRHTVDFQLHSTRDCVIAKIK